METNQLLINYYKKEEVEDIITITFSKEEKKKYFDDYNSIEEIKNYILKVLESR